MNATTQETKTAETADTQISAAAQFCPGVGDAEIVRLLTPIRQKNDLPAIAGAIVTSQGLVAVGAVGVRKKGTDVPVGLDDLWHLGSDTKAMTATVAGALVERGLLKWDTTVSDVFPELAPSFNAGFRNVTVLESLSHHAGLPANLKWGEIARTGTVQEQRVRTVKEALSQPPVHDHGGKYLYSNLGYVIAGAITERISGKSWEQQMQETIFDPLKMKSAGFGGTGTPGQIDQPWPHLANGQPTRRNGPGIDNPPVMGPAGRVHCTIQDWARFIADVLRGAQGGPALLKADTYRTLYMPTFGGNYALGWIVVKRDWGGGLVFNHAGDNTMNHAVAWVAPARDFAVLVCVNQAGAGKPCDAAIGALIKLHNTRNGKDK